MKHDVKVYICVYSYIVAPKLICMITMNAKKRKEEEGLERIQTEGNGGLVYWSEHERLQLI